MVQVVILGLGRFGGTLARLLYKRGHQVLALDVSEDAVDAIKNEVTEAVCMDIRDKQACKLLGLQDYDVGIVAVGSRMDISILGALYLKEFGVPHVIAKAYNQDHQKVLEALGVDEVIIPEEEMAKRVAFKIGAGHLFLDSIPVEEGYVIVSMACPSPFVGKSMRAIDLRNRYHVQVIAIKDVIHDTWNIVPSPDVPLKESDELFILGKTKDLDKLKKLV